MEFEGFYADMGEVPDGMTLERTDNSKGYFPGNCKWANYTEQMRNTRRIRLSMEVARDIRRRRAEGMSCVEIAAIYDIGRRRVYAILNNEIWREDNGNSP